MLGFLRRCWLGFWGYLDVLARLDDIQRQMRGLEYRVEENELEVSSQVDKLVQLHKRQTKRIADGTAAIAEQAPTVTDVRAHRAQRKAQLRERMRGLPPSGSTGTAP